MSQRHYSPDQMSGGGRTDSEEKSNKRLREGGSSNKMMESTCRYNEDEVLVGDYRYRLSDEIGAGYSSRVYKGLGKDKQECAVKVIEMKRFSASGLEMLENEIEILRKLSHPNVIKLFYVHRTQTHTYLVTELCKDGDLLEYMAKKGRLHEDQAALIMGEVVEGVKYLMRMGVIHRDLKPANILRGDRIWKIADFGFSINGREEVRTRQNVGTPLYMPLQSLLKNVYSPQSDVFAVGVMYYELLVGVTPWQCRSEKELIKKLASVPFSIPEKYRVSSHIKYLLQKMCSVDKTVRMSREEFCELNLKNFVSLNNFNDPLLSTSKRNDEIKKSDQKKLPSPAKFRKSKSKPKTNSKDKDKIKQREYKLGRRKKSNDKIDTKSKKSSEKETITAKAYGIREDGSSSAKSIVPQQETGVDRFQIINEKIMGSQLDYCRFMYYMIQNQQYLSLQEDSLKRIVLIIFKHLVKVIKQLTDAKANHFKLPNWDSFRQSQRYKALMPTLHDYCEKYERDYLKYLKESEINVIKEVNQKFSQLGSVEPLNLSFYRKLQTLLASALKDTIQIVVSQEEKLPQPPSGSVEGMKAMLRYYRWVQINVKNFENYAVQRSPVPIVKSYKSVVATWSEVAQLSQEIKAL